MSASSFSMKQTKFGLIPSQKKNKKKKTSGLVSSSLSMFSSSAALQQEQEEEEKEEEEGRGGGGGGDVSRANVLLARGRGADMSLLEGRGGGEGEGGGDIYDYDGAYDVFKKEADRKKVSKLSGGDEAAPKSKYIGHLQAVAKVREIESDRRYERKLLKERKEEDELFGDKQKFVTSAYRKKLKEEEKWAYEDQLADRIEEKTGASRQGMEGFYSNLFTKNIAFGGDVKTSATSAYTAGSDRQNMRINEAKEEEGGGDEDWKKRNTLDEDKKTKDEDKKTKEEDEVKKTKEEETDQGIEQIEERNVSTASITESHKRRHDEAGGDEAHDNSHVDGDATSAIPNTQTRENTVQSARERYLARKKSKTSA